MKKTILAALIAATLVPLFSIAQPTQLQLRQADSLALVAVYNSLGGAQSGLNWLNGPVDNWGDKPDEIVLDSVENTFTDDFIPGYLYVASIDISSRGLSGAIPNEINGMDRLRTLDISNNRISSLPATLSMDFLEGIDLSNNRLRDLPTFAGSLEGVFLDCSDNFLTFEDIVPLVGLPKLFVYDPQKIQSSLEVIAFRDEIIALDAYRVENPLPSNIYQWTKPGTTLSGDTKLLNVNTGNPKTPGLYNLVVRNDAAPDLTFSIDLLLKVIDKENPPFDTGSIIVRGPNAFNPGAYLDGPTANKIKIDSCRCMGPNEAVALWSGIPSIIDLNTIRDGAGSGVDKDTTDLNFFLEVRKQPETAYCEDDYTVPVPPNSTQPFSAKVAVVGTGIANHEDLKPYFYNTSSPIFCLPGQSRVAYDFRTHQIPDTTRAPGNSHETHIAGIISKNFPSNIDLDIADLTIFNREGEGRLFELICAIHFAIEAEVDVINLSLGYYNQEPSPLLYEALRKARNKNITVVVSSGNDGRDNDYLQRWPGNFIIPQSFEGETLPQLDNIIVVGALNAAEDSLADFSNIGANTVHIAAAGTGTKSTSKFIDYEVFSGTSMAAGEVSRIVAILKAYAPFSAKLTPAEIIAAITTSGDDIKTGSFRPNLIHDKKVNLIAAAQALNPPIPRDLMQIIQGESVPPIATDRPPTIINRNRARSVQNFSLTLNEDAPNSIYENVRFVVRRPTGTPDNWEILYEQTCRFASRIRWDGIKLDGNLLNPANNLPFLLIEIPSQQPPSIRIQPVKLRR